MLDEPLAGGLDLLPRLLQLFPRPGEEFPLGRAVLIDLLELPAQLSRLAAHLTEMRALLLHLAGKPVCLAAQLVKLARRLHEPLPFLLGLPTHLAGPPTGLLPFVQRRIDLPAEVGRPGTDVLH